MWANWFRNTSTHRNLSLSYTHRFLRMINCPGIKAVSRFSVLPRPVWPASPSESRWTQCRPSSTLQPSTGIQQTWRRRSETSLAPRVCWLSMLNTRMREGRSCPLSRSGRRASRVPGRSGSSVSRRVTAGWTRSCPCLSCTRSGWENTTGWPDTWHDSTLTGGQRSSTRRHAGSSGRCIR